MHFFSSLTNYRNFQAPLQFQSHPIGRRQIDPCTAQSVLGVLPIQGTNPHVALSRRSSLWQAWGPVSRSRQGIRVHSTPFEEIALRRAFWGFETEFAIGPWKCRPTLRRALDIALHDEVRLMHFFQSSGIFADGHRQ